MTNIIISTLISVPDALVTPIVTGLAAGLSTMALAAYLLQNDTGKKKFLFSKKTKKTVEPIQTETPEDNYSEETEHDHTGINLEHFSYTPSPHVLNKIEAVFEHDFDNEEFNHTTFNFTEEDITQALADDGKNDIDDFAFVIKDAAIKARLNNNSLNKKSQTNNRHSGELEHLKRIAEYKS